MTNIQQELLVRRVATLEALNRYYAVEVINYFLSKQPPKINTPGDYWHNRLAVAATKVFARAFNEGKDFGWFIAHGVDYGVFLELANNRKHAALWPVVQKFARQYLEDVKKIFGGN